MATSSYLLLDLLLDIAARTDPVTLVRCAAMCKDMHRGVADQAFRGRLRLRHADRFVPSLLRGCLVDWNKEIHLLDTTSPYTTRVLSAAASFFAPPSSGGEPSPGLTCKLVASRDGLLLLRTADPPHGKLCVRSAATGRSQTLPPEPAFDGQYVLLVGGDGDGGVVGRPFQVLKASMEFSNRHPCLQTQTFSSEHGTWGPYTEIPTPGVHGSWLRHLSKPLVAVDALHWLCLTDAAGYVLKLHVGAGLVTSTKLPASFGRTVIPHTRAQQIALAAMSVGGNPVVLVADTRKISMWTRPERSARWRERPQVVIDNEAILEFTQMSGWPGTPRLEWFAEKSGIVLIRSHHCGYLWLDLQSREIIRWFSVPSDFENDVNCPYEDLSSWFPTFRQCF
ncbi:hypothetical protein ACP70R_020597 [Stipagrostis hirtigluma subsp. patula]